MANRVDKTPALHAKLRFFLLLPLFDGMKMAQAPLLVALDDKLARVARHWAVVNEALPLEFPLVLQHGVVEAGFVGLSGRLPGFRDGVDAAELNVKLARAAYERRKGDVHEWVRAIHVWMRANYRGTDCFALMRRMPGRGRCCQYWREAARGALGMWVLVVTNPPPGPGGWPKTLWDGRTMEEFAVVVKSFEEAHVAIIAAEVDLKIARGILQRAQAEATALLMAYGHGVRARLRDHGALVDSIPQLWPGHSSRPKVERAVAA